MNRRLSLSASAVAMVLSTGLLLGQGPRIGSERAVPDHLQPGAEFTKPIETLVSFGKLLFTANWTEEDGAGRPLTNGAGAPLQDPTQPLTGRRAFNRVSGPDANSCAGCHNSPLAIPGGGGDFVTNAFLMSERFDFVTFDRKDTRRTRGSLDEAGRPATLQTVGNSRSTPGLFGAGYLEMLARQMTEDLQRTRDAILPGQSKTLASKGVSFGVLKRRADGRWDASGVEGLPPQSLMTSPPAGKPSLIIRPWHQSGSVVSLRDFTNTAFNRHMGIQTAERFGLNMDPDGDGVRNEMTGADVTAVTLFQATLPVPGRVIPNNPEIERLVLTGETTFQKIGCTTCHVPSLALERKGWIYSEPGPFNPLKNLQRTGVRLLEVDLSSDVLPQPRLARSPTNPSVVDVPAYTDFKLHDITDPNDGMNKEPLDMNQRAGSAKFLAGNRKFLTRRLWGAANEPPYFHHGLFTTLREAVMAHAGEAIEQRRAFDRLTKYEQDGVLEFLGTLQVLPPGTKELIVDERYKPKRWPPALR